MCAKAPSFPNVQTKSVCLALWFFFWISLHNFFLAYVCNHSRRVVKKNLSGSIVFFGISLYSFFWDVCVFISERADEKRLSGSMVFFWFSLHIFFGDVCVLTSERTDQKNLTGFESFFCDFFVSALRNVSSNITFPLCNNEILWDVCVFWIPNVCLSGWMILFLVDLYPMCVFPHCRRSVCLALCFWFCRRCVCLAGWLFFFWFHPRQKTYWDVCVSSLPKKRMTHVGWLWLVGSLKW